MASLYVVGVYRLVGPGFVRMIQVYCILYERSYVQMVRIQRQLVVKCMCGLVSDFFYTVFGNYNRCFVCIVVFYGTSDDTHLLFEQSSVYRVCLSFGRVAYW